MSRAPARRSRGEESGNSFVLFVVLLPILLGAFGLGLDMTRNVYIRTSLQNALDMATAAGAAVTTTAPGGRTVLRPEEALQTVEQVYALNRSTGPALACLGSRQPVAGTTLGKCWVQPAPPVLTDTTITYTVRERSTNAFLQVLGVPYQDYRLQSRSRVNQTTQ